MPTQQFISEMAQTPVQELSEVLQRYVKEACTNDKTGAASTLVNAIYEAAQEAEQEGWELLTVDELLDRAAALGGLEWLIPNFLVNGGVHFVTAPASGGKSWLLLDMALHVAAGHSWLQHEITEASPVLYIDEEMGDMQARNRVQKLSAIRGIPFFYLGKQGFALFDTESRRKVCAIIKEHGIKLLIIDTLTGSAPGFRENESEHVSKLRAFLKEFTKLGATVVVAHHDRKGGQGDALMAHERMAGSRDLAAQGDMCYGLEVRSDLYTLTTIKNRHLPPDDAPAFTYTLEDAEDKSTVALNLVGENEVASRIATRQKSILEDRILQVLAGAPGIATSDLCSQVKGSPNAVLQAAKEMAAGGKIQRVKIGKEFIFTLSDHSDNESENDTEII